MNDLRLLRRQVVLMPRVLGLTHGRRLYRAQVCLQCSSTTLGVQRDPHHPRFILHWKICRSTHHLTNPVRTLLWHSQYQEIQLRALETLHPRHRHRSLIVVLVLSHLHHPPGRQRRKTNLNLRPSLRAHLSLSPCPPLRRLTLLVLERFDVRCFYDIYIVVSLQSCTS